MHIKRFEAASMQEALAKVKAELGDDALILGTRTISVGNRAFGLMSRPRIEVQAAVERGKKRGDARTRREMVGSPAESSDFSDQVAQMRHEMERVRRSADFEEEMRTEIRGLRDAVDRMRGGDERSSVECREDEPNLGLAPRIADQLRKAYAEVRVSDESLGFEPFLRARIESRLSPPREDHGRKTRILVGAPGVGKTTTLAKLAARNEEGERDVAFVSLDDYRIGAAEQLAAYARRLDSPFRALSEPCALLPMLSEWHDRAILVDTAGQTDRGERSMVAWAELRRRLGDRGSVELVLDATTRPEVQRSQLARFGPLAPDRLIVTKVDEADSLLGVADLVLDEDCPPVCWLGTGQRVPEDLTLADSSRLSRAILEAAA